MGSDLAMGYNTNCCGGTGYYDKINTIQRDTHKTKVIIKINQQLDTYTSKMLEKKIRELMNEMAGSLPSITFPAPYKISRDDSKNNNDGNSIIQVIPISCIDVENISLFGYTHKWIYHLPIIDEYYGDLNYVHKYDNVNKYDKVSTNINKQYQLQQQELNSNKYFDSLDEANQWFDDFIHKSLYALGDDEKEEHSMRNRQKLPYKIFNEWDDVNIDKLGMELCTYFPY